jgi:hypothetical protein
VSTAFRIVLVIAAAGIVLALVLGPAWRGSFYRSWLRPRLIAFGIVLMLVAAGAYVYRVINAIRSH